MNLAIWGVTNPIKAIVPPIDTQTPIKIEIIISSWIFVDLTFIPTWAAFSSPIAKALSSLYFNEINTNEITKTKKIKITSL